MDLTFLIPLACQLGQMLQTQGLKLVTAESCTGGGIGAALTAVPGSSLWYEGGFITYSNAAKEELLGVDPVILSHHGAVSEATADAMVKGALIRSHAQLALAVTGIAGPAGGGPNKPVGTVCFAWLREGYGVQTATHYFTGDRGQVRQQAAFHALEGIRTRLMILGSGGGEG